MEILLPVGCKVRIIRMERSFYAQPKKDVIGLRGRIIKVQESSPSFCYIVKLDKPLNWFGEQVSEVYMKKSEIIQDSWVPRNQ